MQANAADVLSRPGMETAIATFIAIICGGLLNMAAAVWAEHRRRARLTVHVEPQPLDTYLAQLFDATAVPQSFRSLRVVVSNDPQGWLDRWMASPALQCRAVITFHDVSDGKEMFGRSMQGRWAGSPQPTSIPVVNRTTQAVDFFILDPGKMVVESRIDIYPGFSEPLDIAVRFQGDEDCYGWNNETYFKQPVGKNPDWKLGHNRFLVKVVVTSLGQRCEGVFRLINNVPQSSFRLEEADDSEIAKVK
jgi:hypothetical protein